MKSLSKSQLLFIAGLSISSTIPISTEETIQDMNQRHEKENLDNDYNRKLYDKEIENAHNWHTEKASEIKEKLKNNIIDQTEHDKQQQANTDYRDERLRIINRELNNKEYQEKKAAMTTRHEEARRKAAKQADTALQNQLEKVVTAENMNDADTKDEAIKTIQEEYKRNMQEVKSENQKIITAIKNLTQDKIKELRAGPKLSKDDNNYQVQRALQGTGVQDSPFENPLDIADKTTANIKKELIMRVNKGLKVLKQKITSHAEQQIKNLTSKPSSDEDDFDTIDENDTQDTNSQAPIEQPQKTKSWLPKTIRRWLHNLGLRNDAEIVMENQDNAMTNLGFNPNESIPSRTILRQKLEQQFAQNLNIPIEDLYQTVRDHNAMGSLKQLADNLNNKKLQKLYKDYELLYNKSRS